jgi:hypothetical protein
MDPHCLAYLSSLSEPYELVVPKKNCAEACLHDFLAKRKHDPSLGACFVIGQKAWKSRRFFLEYRTKAKLKELARGCRGEHFMFSGKAGTFPFSFVLACVMPQPSCQIGHVGNLTPLNLTFAVTVRGIEFRALMDTGATHSFVRGKVLQGLKYDKAVTTVVLADGSLSETKGKVDLSVRFTPSVVTRHNFFVCDSIMEGVDIILGQDWMSPRDATVSVGVGKAQIKHQGKWVTLDPHRKILPCTLQWGMSLVRKGKKKFDQWRLCLLNVVMRPEEHVWDEQEEESSQEVNEQNLSDDESNTSSTSSKGPGTQGGPVPEADPEPQVEGEEEGMLEEEEEQTSSSGKLTGSSGLDEVLQGKPEPLGVLLREYTDLFPKGLPGLPPHRHVYHTIRIQPSSVPPNKPAYRLSSLEMEECTKTVDELLALGHIRPSHSPYASPVLFVKKKEGTYRMVIDYRAVNHITIPDRYPLPRIDDLLDRLKGAKVFSSLDLLSGYHQVRLKEEDIPKTAFRTPFGLYEFLVLPFGLTNAPATFQRLMNEIFHDFIREGFVVVYLDDVLIFSKDENMHYVHLEKVFARLREKQLFAKLPKCEFMRSELRYLGHIIGKNGLKVDPQKVEVVKDWPTPKTTTDVRRFLGLANYFRKFIRDFSAIAAPLTKLSSSKRAWEWGMEQEESFSALKTALVEAPILSLPDLRKPFQVTCDASDFGVGAVLMQDGKVVAYYSKKLNSAERNYSATERELLAVVYALQEWRCYVLGKPVTVTTDHKCNTFLQQQAGLSPRRARWAERLQEFDILWVWEPGKTNVADALSRVPVLAARQLRRNVEPAEPKLRSVEPRVAMDSGGRARPSGVTHQLDTCEPFLELVKRAYMDDEWLGKRSNRRKVHFRNGIWEYGKEGRKYVPGHYEVKDGEGVVGRNLRQDILKALHDPLYIGHPGFAKMYELVKREWWWPGMTEDVREYVAYCDSCQRVKASNKLPSGLLHPLQIPTRKWQSISMDFITGLPRSANGNDAIWVVVDRLSKCAHFVPTTTKADSYDVAVLLRDKVWRYHGFPEELVSDRDPKFVSKFMDILLNLTGCKPARSTAYHPQSDGQTERVNRILEDYLKHYVWDKPQEWENHLAVAEFAYNNTWQASINTTPFRLTYGQDPNIPFAMGHMEGGKADRADLFLRKMQDSLTLARKFLAAAQERQAAQANRHRRAVVYKEGDLVFLRTTFPPALMSHKYIKLARRRIGPFRVIAVHPNNYVELDIPPAFKFHPKINIQYVDPYKGPRNAPDYTYQPGPRMVKGADGKEEPEYVVEGILGHRPLMEGKRALHFPDGTPAYEYWVLWSGYKIGDDWEPLDMFDHAKHTINTYHEHQELGPPKWGEKAA